jgi:hypothetical protein
MQSLHVSRVWAPFSHARAIPVLVAVFAVLTFASPRTAKAQSGSWMWTSQTPSLDSAVYSQYWGQKISNVGNGPYTLTETASGLSQYIYALFAMDVTTGASFGYQESGHGTSAIHTFTLVDEAPGLYWWGAGLSTVSAPLIVMPNYRAPWGPFGYINGP